MRKVFEVCDDVDYDYVCKTYSKALDAQRLNVNSGALLALMKPAKVPKTG